MNRRQFLSTSVAAASTGLILPSQGSALSLFGFDLGRSDQPKTPKSEQRLNLHNIHTGETFNDVFRADGSYLPEALKSLNHFMRDRRNNKQINMDPKLFDLLHTMQKLTGTKKPFEIVCGYRSPQTNEGLRRQKRGVAKNSQHLYGRAVDLFSPDVRLRDLRTAALSQKKGGVGFYPKSNFVHVDTRGHLACW